MSFAFQGAGCPRKQAAFKYVDQRFCKLTVASILDPKGPSTNYPLIFTRLIRNY